MEIIVVESEAEVASIASDYLAHYATKGANLGVATGSTPLATYRELIRHYRASDVTFKDCSFFALDEYVGLPIEHEQSYCHVIHNEFSDCVDVNPARVHVPDGFADDIGAACEDYERKIIEAGGIDIHKTLCPRATVVIDQAAASELKNKEYYNFTYAHKLRWQKDMWK